MKKIIEYLQENNMNFKKEKYGNPYYFNDGFFVDGIRVSFDIWLDGKEALQKMNNLEKFMKNKRSYIIKTYGYGIKTYDILTIFDFTRLKEHEKAIADAIEKFWQEEHARRMQEKKAI